VGRREGGYKNFPLKGGKQRKLVHRGAVTGYGKVAKSKGGYESMETEEIDRKTYSAFGRKRQQKERVSAQIGSQERNEIKRRHVGGGQKEGYAKVD